MVLKNHFWNFLESFLSNCTFETLRCPQSHFCAEALLFSDCCVMMHDLTFIISFALLPLTFVVCSFEFQVFYQVVFTLLFL